MRTWILVLALTACGGRAERVEQSRMPPPPPPRDRLGEHVRELAQRLAPCRDPADPQKLVLDHACRAAVRTLVAGCGTADLRELARTDRVTEPCKASLHALLPEADSFRSRLLALGAVRAGGMLEIYITASDVLGEPAPLDAKVSLEIDGTLRPVDGEVTALPAHCDVPVFSVSSILDYSGSMSDRDIDESIAIFETLYDALGEGCLETDAVLFSTTVHHRREVTANRAAMRAAIARDVSIPRATTALVDALGVGVHALARRRPPVRLAIVATDGRENDSRHHALGRVLQQARDERIRIISFGSLLSDTAFLEHAGRQTGGFFIYRPHPKLLVDASKIVGRLLGRARRIRIPEAARATAVIVESGGQRIRVPL